MQYSTRKRIGALATTVPILMLTLIMLTSPSASAALLPLHRLPVNHQMVFKSAIAANAPNIPTIIAHPNIGLLVNHRVDSNTAMRLFNENGNSNSHTSNTISSPVVVNHINQGVTTQDTSSKDKHNNSHTSNTISSPVVVNDFTQSVTTQESSGDNSNDNNNGNHDKNSNDNNNHNPLDVQDKSFVNGIKITDVDRSNPHLLKVTLKRTHENDGSIPKYVAVVAVGKDDQTVAGSTTLRSDDISNILTVNVVLKNKNNKNGHLDESADVIVWVVPAALHDISGNQ